MASYLWLISARTAAPTLVSVKTQLEVGVEHVSFLSIFGTDVDLTDIHFYGTFCPQVFGR